MLTQLRFKNWRSLRDVTIDNLTPLTVFIGANSSGKTNIVDGLRFLRECVDDKPINAIQNRGGASKVYTLQNDAGPLEIGIIYKLENEEISYQLGLKFGNDFFPDIYENLDEINKRNWLNRPYGSGSTPPATGLTSSLIVDSKKTVLLRANSERLALRLLWNTSPGAELLEFITERLQILDEGFKPTMSNQLGQYGDIQSIAPNADNLPMVINFIRVLSPEIYNELDGDLNFLMKHVERLQVERNEREIRLFIKEANQPSNEAPTISAGTARIVAMLTAYYALNIGPLSQMPGLVVIEEPDTAMNPGLLQRFVDLLRRYVREGNRQFILTTHNPSLLNYFQPEEVRVVSRDENGDTTVQPVPSHIRDIWLTDDAEYGLGEVWTTNVFGGLPK
ncbi:MAG: ATP-binding protein [Anaerolineae bacterium]|nr:ATP-binding protein [Anaerolineae bacterium]